VRYAKSQFLARDITIENDRHPRLIRILDWNIEDFVLTMEYMPNANLQAFLKENDTTEIQRLRCSCRRAVTSSVMGRALIKTQWLCRSCLPAKRLEE
jgi:hypothetical protein